MDSLMLRFCTLVHDTVDMPVVINAIAADADFVRLCRQLVPPPHPAAEARLLATCSQQMLNSERILRRIQNVARCLRLDPEPVPPDHYAILGVPVSADKAAIKHAFRENAKFLHPDRRKEGGEGFLQLQAAYDCLSDPARRRRYDEERLRSGLWFEPSGPPPPPRPSRGYGGLAVTIGLLLLVLGAAVGLMDLLYSETDFFGGPGRGAPRPGRTALPAADLQEPGAPPAGQGPAQAAAAIPEWNEQRPAADGKPALVKDEKPGPARDEKPRLVRDENPRPVQDEKPRPVHDAKPGPVKDEKTRLAQDEKPRPVQENQALAVSEALKRRPAERRPEAARPDAGAGRAGSTSAPEPAQPAPAPPGASPAPQAPGAPLEAGDSAGSAPAAREKSAGAGNTSAPAARKVAGTAGAPPAAKGTEAGAVKTSAAVAAVAASQASAAAAAAPQAPPAAGAAGQATAAPTPAPAPTLEAELHRFLAGYCKAYASKDLEKFMGYFTPDATEKGRPIQSTLPAYRATFDALKTVDYSIAVKSFAERPDSGLVYLEGRFKAKYELQQGGGGESSGTIWMELADQAGELRVKKLEYLHQ